jgi:hypothetical protein
MTPYQFTERHAEIAAKARDLAEAIAAHNAVMEAVRATVKVEREKLYDKLNEIHDLGATFPSRRFGRSWDDLLFGSDDVCDDVPCRAVVPAIEARVHLVSPCNAD